MIIHVTNFKVKCISEINNIVFLYIQLFSRTDAHNFVRMFICIYMLVDILCNGKWWSFHFKYYLCSEKQTVCGGFVFFFFLLLRPFIFLCMCKCCLIFWIESIGKYMFKQIKVPRSTVKRLLTMDWLLIIH